MYKDPKAQKNKFQQEIVAITNNPNHKQLIICRYSIAKRKKRMPI
jgi:hypothetical protein